MLDSKAKMKTMVGLDLCDELTTLKLRPDHVF